MLKPRFNIVIIGSGNMANALGKLFSRNHNIVQVISRNKKTGIALAKKLKATYSSSINDLSTTADFYFLCVPDDAIKTLSAKLKHVKGMVVHHSGSRPLHEISCKNKAVLYPYSSIQKESNLNHPDTTIFYQTGHKSQALLLVELCKDQKFNLQKSTDDLRMKLHFCAVLVNNFTNHLYEKTTKILGKNTNYKSLLTKLAKQSLENFEQNTTKIKQTGPARRGDKKTMNLHLNLIKKDKNLSKIYLSLSQSIQHNYE